MPRAWPAAAETPRPRVFYGWWIVIVYLVLNLYWSGTLVVSLSVFFTPIRQSFGWSAGLLAAIFSLESLAASLLAPLVGLIFDRHGPRALMLAATGLGGSGLLLLSRATALWSFAGAFLVLSLGFAIWYGGTGPATAALWFVRRRGSAIGLLLIGTALGGLLVPLWSAAVAAAGWRTSVALAGVALVLVSLPLCFLLRHRPEHYGLAPDGDPLRPSGAGSSPPQAGAGFRAATATWQFWAIATTAAAASLGGAATSVHLLTSLKEVHVAPSTAIAAVSATSLLGIPGRLSAGWLADRIGVVGLLAGTYLLQGIGLLLLAGLGGRPFVLLPAILAYGLGSNNVFLVPILLLVRYFGTTALGRIQGILILVSGIGRVLGPILAGSMHDQLHGYPAAYLLLAALSLLACLPILGLRPPRLSQMEAVASR